MGLQIADWARQEHPQSTIRNPKSLGCGMRSRHSLTTDRWLILSSAGLRAAAVGLSGILLTLHLTTLNFSAWSLGWAVSLGLAGCAIGTALVTCTADRVGRRATLIALAVLMACGGVALACLTRASLIMMSVLVGMVNGMGRDRGAGLTVEQALLPQTTVASERTVAFAWYNLVIDAGHAVGALLGAIPALLRAHTGVSMVASYQWTWGLYSLLCVASGCFAAALSSSVERYRAGAVRRLSPASRSIIAKFAVLSGIDSLGGGFLTTAMVSYWFFRRFGVDEAVLAPVFCAARVANGVSHLAAAWLAKRIGLVNTMVWTHLPSSLLLMTVPWAPSLTVAIVLFLIRESLVEMDVPTRQSYLVAMVKEDERIRASGVTNLTRSVAWAVAPAAAGMMMRSLWLSAPLVVGPGLKIAYDVLLYRVFRHLKTPEEQGK